MGKQTNTKNRVMYIRYELLSSFYLHGVSLYEINQDAQADLALESYANYKGQLGMILKFCIR